MFWLAVTLLVLLIPLMLIIFGIVFLRTSFIGINAFFGYRTRRSRRSKETWRYAHSKLGKIWLILGCIIFPIYLIVMLFLINQGDSVVGLVGGILILLSVIPVAIPIIPVERGLKKHFDIFGKRINPEE